jgi:nucleotide-binding universal stress UspA family protein
MESVNRILVALGFSSYAQQTFDYAAMLAQRMEAELVIGSIINSKDIRAVHMVSAMGYDVDSDHYIKGVKQERRDALEKILAHSTYQRDQISLIFRAGNPVEALLELIVSEKIDLLVMGVKGHSDIEHVFIGSVAEKLFRRSPVPVVSVRDAQTAERLRSRIQLD